MKTPSALNLLVVMFLLSAASCGSSKTTGCELVGVIDGIACWDIDYSENGGLLAISGFMKQSGKIATRVYDIQDLNVPKIVFESLEGGSNNAWLPSDDALLFGARNRKSLAVVDTRTWLIVDDVDFVFPFAGGLAIDGSGRAFTTVALVSNFSPRNDQGHWLARLKNIGEFSDARPFGQCVESNAFQVTASKTRAVTRVAVSYLDACDVEIGEISIVDGEERIKMSGTIPGIGLSWLRLSADGSMLVFLNREGLGVVQWGTLGDVSGIRFLCGGNLEAESLSIPYGMLCQRLSMSDNGELIACSFDTYTSVINMATGQEVVRVNLPSQGCDLSGNGELLAVARRDVNEVRLYRLADGCRDSSGSHVPESSGVTRP